MLISEFLGILVLKPNHPSNTCPIISSYTSTQMTVMLASPLKQSIYCISVGLCVGQCILMMVSCKNCLFLYVLCVFYKCSSISLHTNQKHKTSSNPCVQFILQFKSVNMILCLNKYLFQDIGTEYNAIKQELNDDKNCWIVA